MFGAHPVAGHCMPLFAKSHWPRVTHACSFLLSLQTGERGHLKEVDGAVELLLSTLLFILSSGNSNSHLSWHISAASGPEEVV